MKKSLIILYLLSIIFASGCDIYTTVDCQFPYKYDEVYFFIPESKEKWVGDTSLCFSRDDLELLKLNDLGDGEKRGQITVGNGDIDYQFKYWQCDTVSFFFFDKDTIDTYPWDYIVQNYCVLQRYDFSKEDLVRLNYQISYPPTEEMAHIHMYPPYKE